MRAQYLDRMDASASAPRTVKSQAVRSAWQVDGVNYALTSIDTHDVEVSAHSPPVKARSCWRSTAQGIRAQTLNLYLAMENDLTIIPVLNKIDLPRRPREYAAEMGQLVK